MIKAVILSILMNIAFTGEPKVEKVKENEFKVEFVEKGKWSVKILNTRGMIIHEESFKVDSIKQIRIYRIRNNVAEKFEFTKSNVQNTTYKVF